MKRFSVFLGVVLGGVLLSVVVLGLWPRVYEAKTEFAVIAAKDLDKVVPGQRVYPEEHYASIMSTRWSFYRNEEFLVEVLRCYRAQASEHSLSDEEVWKCLITSGCGLESRTNMRKTPLYGLVPYRGIFRMFVSAIGSDCLISCYLLEQIFEILFQNIVQRHEVAVERCAADTRFGDKLGYGDIAELIFLQKGKKRVCDVLVDFMHDTIVARLYHLSQAVLF